MTYEFEVPVQILDDQTVDAFTYFATEQPRFFRDVEIVVEIDGVRGRVARVDDVEEGAYRLFVIELDVAE